MSKKTKRYSVPVRSHVSANYIVWATSKDAANKIVDKEMTASMLRQLKEADPHPAIKNIDGYIETIKFMIEILP